MEQLILSVKDMFTGTTGMWLLSVLYIELKYFTVKTGHRFILDYSEVMI